MSTSEGPTIGTLHLSRELTAAASEGVATADGTTSNNCATGGVAAVVGKSVAIKTFVAGALLLIAVSSDCLAGNSLLFLISSAAEQSSFAMVLTGAVEGYLDCKGAPPAATGLLVARGLRGVGGGDGALDSNDAPPDAAGLLAARGLRGVGGGDGALDRTRAGDCWFSF